MVTRDQLLACLSVPRWADDVLADAPYADRASLLASADEAARSLSDDELAQALAGHPRIGERAAAGHNAAASAKEQAGVVSTGSTDVTERLVAGNVAYEERFGHVFLIRAAGRSGAEILGELDRRLGNSDDDERAETVDNLRQIALLRLEGMV
jgi:2-oxo-4-hydroxy-4-carboxy-5-ureidoimidazoline decarboxylase